jgi:hypothetical protein
MIVDDVGVAATCASQMFDHQRIPTPQHDIDCTIEMEESKKIQQNSIIVVKRIA